MLSSTFPFADTAELIAYMRGELERPHEYGRYGNPTVAAAERRLAALEAGEAALLCASGMAAVSLIFLALLRSGQHLVLTADVYRKTRQLAKQLLPRFGIEVSSVDPTAEAVARALRPETRLVLTELPTNPYLRVIDLPAVAEICRQAGVKLVVDATFATPLNLRSLERGADLVVHSTTKYLGGHNDLLGGVIVGAAGLISALRDQQGALGAIADPLSAYLLMRGLKTLALRVERQNQSALALAGLLAAHPAVERVWYPLHPSHPDHEVARRLLAGGGGVLSFELRGGLAAGTAVCDRVTIPKLAPSLGGVESLIEQPALMSFFDHDEAQLAAVGIRPGLVRLSVGIEDLADLRADLGAALDSL